MKLEKDSLRFRKRRAMHHLTDEAHKLFRDLSGGNPDGIDKVIFYKYFPNSNQFLRLNELSLKWGSLRIDQYTKASQVDKAKKDNSPNYPRLLSELQSLNKEVGNIIREITPLIREKYDIDRKISEQLNQKEKKENEEKHRKQAEEDRKKRLEEAKKLLIPRIRADIDSYFTALQRNFNNAVVMDEYGGVIKDNKFDEFERFLKSRKIINTNFEEEESANREVIYSEFYELCRRIDNENKTGEGSFDPLSYPEDGLEFENWVAVQLEKFGWKAYKSPSSGDQGIDVIGEYDGISLGIQCKLYSDPVGNKAVQECLSGKYYYELNFASVLTNSTYTKSAIELANKTDVQLLHIGDIPLHL